MKIAFDITFFKFILADLQDIGTYKSHFLINLALFSGTSVLPGLL